MVTDKNKEQFEKYFTDNYDSEFMPDDKFSRYIWFIKQPFEMQIGVYLAYYDSLGVYINISFYKSNSTFANCSYKIISKGIDLFEHTFISRNEAYKEAFKKANELINKQLN